MSRVSVSAAKARLDKVYAQGCSGLTADLLGLPWKSAKSYKVGEYAGVDNDYEGLSPGDIVFVDTPHGHVAVYIGEPGCVFIHCKEPNAKTTKIKHGFGPYEVYKASY